jgi:hypothetical protein
VDSNIAVALVTGGSTCLLGISALFLNGKRMDDMKQELVSLRTAIDLLTGSLHEVDKRLSIIEDRIIRKDG